MDYHNIIEFTVHTLYNAVSTPFKKQCSRTAITGLSYPAIPKGCPSRYQVFQISPPTPYASRRTQQPTCVVPSRLDMRFKPTRTAINDLILHPAIVSPSPNKQGWSSYLDARVRVAQSQKIHYEWIEESIATLSARHSRASEVSPARSFVEAVFLAKNCRGRYKKIGGLATPPFSTMARWSAPKMAEL
jgi:hypothetical protein